MILKVGMNQELSSVSVFVCVSKTSLLKGTERTYHMPNKYVWSKFLRPSLWENKQEGSFGLITTDFFSPSSKELRTWSVRSKSQHWEASPRLPTAGISPSLSHQAGDNTANSIKNKANSWLFGTCNGKMLKADG